MRMFYELFVEAYTYVPKSEKDIDNLPDSYSADEKEDIKKLFNYLKTTHPNTESLINVDPKQKGSKTVNVFRALSTFEDIKEIKSKSKISSIKIKFGNGSSGNRGVNNRGNLFEGIFASAIEKYRDGSDDIPSDMLAAIRDLDSLYKIRESNRFEIDVVGERNTKRPLKYSPIELTNPGSGYNIGKAVSDIDLTTDEGTI